MQWFQTLILEKKLSLRREEEVKQMLDTQVKKGFVIFENEKKKAKRQNLRRNSRRSLEERGEWKSVQELMKKIEEDKDRVNDILRFADVLPLNYSQFKFTQTWLASCFQVLIPPKRTQNLEIEYHETAPSDYEIGFQDCRTIVWWRNGAFRIKVYNFKGEQTFMENQISDTKIPDSFSNIFKKWVDFVIKKIPRTTRGSNKQIFWTTRSQDKGKTIQFITPRSSSLLAKDIKEYLGIGPSLIRTVLETTAENANLTREQKELFSYSMLHSPKTAREMYKKKSPEEISEEVEQVHRIVLGLENVKKKEDSPENPSSDSDSFLN